MTQDEIIRMAEEAGFKRETTLTYGYPYTAYKANIERFAALVAAHEREKFYVLLRQVHDSISLASDPSGFIRGEK